MSQLRQPADAPSAPPKGPAAASRPADPSIEDPAARRRRWRDDYVRRIRVSDLVCAALGGAAGFVVRFGGAETPPPTTTVWVTVLLPLVWLLSMAVARTYEERFLWEGPEEFRRILLAAALLLAIVGTVSWAVKLEVARGLVVVALPLTMVLTLGQRYARRRWLRARRRQGLYLQRTLLVGHRNGVEELYGQIRRRPSQGYRVIGCCLPGGRAAAHTFGGLPVLGDLSEVAQVVGRHDVDTVAVLPSPELDGASLRRLAWELEETDAELLLAPGVTEIVGSRVRIRPTFGLALVHMDRPELGGIRRLTKELFDRGAAMLTVVAIAPVLLSIAVLVKVTSPGPVFFTQERLGRHGATFRMLKFRTMVDGADRMDEVLTRANDGNGVLFKMRADPRVTHVGAALRRYSLDELPQLLNIIRGEMSLVGPRPPLRREVERYGLDMHRRFLVKPGLTGLWQISGRSNLSWDESVRADVLYVENWSLTFDLMILWRTVGAVLRGSGAY